MNWLDIPPLSSLRAFAAVAEAKSVSLAAARLNVTHPAVSQQVKQLERRLGVSLIRRTGRGIELTDEGAALARDLDVGFSTIERGLDRLRREGEDRPVQVTMPPAFATEWLMPRIVRFQQLHPEITLLFNPTAELVELKPGGTEVAIRYRDRRWPGGELQPVLVSDMIVVGTPDLIGEIDVSHPAALAGLPWLQELGTNEVAEWFTFHGVVPATPPTVHQMPGSLIMGAVRRGDGLTYTARAFFQDDLARGRLVELYSDSAFGTYHVETAPGPHRAPVKAFLKWLAANTERVVA